MQQKDIKAEYTHNVQKIKVTVKNTWSDLDNVVDSRPAKLVVEIYANGKATGRRVTLTASNKWTAAVTNLDIRMQQEKRISVHRKSSWCSERLQHFRN